MNDIIPEHMGMEVDVESYHGSTYFKGGMIFCKMQDASVTEYQTITLKMSESLKGRENSSSTPTTAQPN